MYSPTLHLPTGERVSLPACLSFWKSQAHRCLQAPFRDYNMLSLPVSLIRCPAMTHFNHSFLLLAEMPFPTFLNAFLFPVNSTARRSLPTCTAGSTLGDQSPLMFSFPTCAPETLCYFVKELSSFAISEQVFQVWALRHSWRYPPRSFFSCRINMPN